MEEISSWATNPEKDKNESNLDLPNEKSKDSEEKIEFENTNNHSDKPEINNNSKSNEIKNKSTPTNKNNYQENTANVENNLQNNKINITSSTNRNAKETTKNEKQELKSKLLEEITNLLETMSPHNVKVELMRKNYAEQEIEVTLAKIVKSSKSILKKNSEIILFKDFFDKIGYAFSSPLIMFIFLYILKTPLIIIGVISGLKTLVTLVTSSIVKEYNKKFSINKKLIATFGVLFGFTFLYKAIAISVNSYILFAIGLLFASIFIVIHGELYSSYVIKKLSRARSNITSKLISYFGLLITALAFVSACHLFNKGNINIHLLNFHLTIPSYLLAFEIIAFAFIFSSYAFSFVKPDINIKKSPHEKSDRKEFLKLYIKSIRINFKGFMKNKTIKSIFFGALFSGALQTIISTFAGIYVYNEFQNSTGNGFLYVGFIFGVGILVASIAPGISRKMIKIFGETPLLVFSLFLTIMFPLSLYFRLNITGLILSHAISIIGASSLSIVQSMIIKKSLNQEERKTYFSTITPVISILLPIIVISFAIIAQQIGLQKMFLIIAILSIILITPFYFVLVLRENSKHNKASFVDNA